MLEYKIFIEPNEFDKDDICVCEAYLFNKQNKLLFTFEDIHCSLRKYRLNKPKTMPLRDFKRVVNC